jgi:hypothetical protein
MRGNKSSRARGTGERDMKFRFGSGHDSRRTGDRKRQVERNTHNSKMKEIKLQRNQVSKLRFSTAWPQLSSAPI